MVPRKRTIKKSGDSAKIGSSHIADSLRFVVDWCRPFAAGGWGEGGGGGGAAAAGVPECEGRCAKPKGAIGCGGS